MAGGTAALRVAVVGARRVRHGTGAFLARHCRRAGARVCAVVGTTAESAEAARAALAVDGPPVSAWTDLPGMLEAVKPGALVVASPAGAHLEALQAALEARVHVLCEKPLLASASDGPEAGRAQVPRARALARAFAAAGLVLEENCQWVRTLEVFRRLHPGFDPAGASSFRMDLAPAVAGRAAWVELLSHPLSLLQEALPGPTSLDGIRFEADEGPGGGERLRFGWRVAEQRIQCEVRCVVTAERPRPAAYAFDGQECRRRIEEPGYRFFFSAGAGGEELASPDPMAEHVAAFLRRAEAAAAGGAVAPDERLVQRQALLAELLRAHACR